MFWISFHFLQFTQASCISNGYKSDCAVIEMKWVNGSFDRGSSYYQINVEVLKDKDYIQDVKNMSLGSSGGLWKYIQNISVGIY